MLFYTLITYSFTLSISCLTLCVKPVSFASHTNTHNHVLTHNLYNLLYKELLQNPATELTRFLRPRPFILNGILYIHKMTHHYINKTNFPKIILIWLINFSDSLSACILKSSDPVLPIVPGVGLIHSVHILYLSSAWYILFRTNNWLKMISSIYS